LLLSFKKLNPWALPKPARVALALEPHYTWNGYKYYFNSEDEPKEKQNGTVNP
jgi:hypothetical protein